MDEFDRRTWRQCQKDEEEYRARLRRQSDELRGPHRQGNTTLCADKFERDTFEQCQRDKEEYRKRLRQLSEAYRAAPIITSPDSVPQKNSAAQRDAKLDAVVGAALASSNPNEMSETVFKAINEIWQCSGLVGHVGVAQHLGQIGKTSPENAATALKNLAAMVTRDACFLSRCVIGHAVVSIGDIGRRFPAVHGAACVELLAAAMNVNSSDIQQCTAQELISIGHLEKSLRGRVLTVLEASTYSRDEPVRTTALRGVQILVAENVAALQRH